MGAPIELSDVSYFYGRGNLRKQILFNLSIQIDAGEIVILTGPSGSGKTTLLSLIGALRSAQEGRVGVLGQELKGASEKTLIDVRRQIGYIFQQHNLLDCLTIEQNVMMALQLHRPLQSDDSAHIGTVLQRVGLGAHAHKFPSELSGGQKQRAGIARALINRPAIILADEPTASLDKQSGRDVVDLIQDLAREDGAAVVLVTHDNRILDVADRIVHLEDGYIKTFSEAVSEGTSRLLNLLEKHDPGTANYLASFSFALARVAYADNTVTEEEREAMRSVLKEVADLQPAEVEFVMELSMMQRRAKSGVNDQGDPLSQERGKHFLDSLHAIANADGHASPEELAEIKAIAAELGIKPPE